MRFPHLQVLHMHFPVHMIQRHNPVIHESTAMNIIHNITIMTIVPGCDNCMLNPIIKYY